MNFLLIFLIPLCGIVVAAFLVKIHTVKKMAALFLELITDKQQ